MEKEQKRRIVEGVILASPDPITPARIAELIPRCNPSQVRAFVKELNEEYVEQRRAFEIWEVAGGFQLRTLPEFSPYLRQIQKTRPLRLSPAALETLSVIAYRQPVTRAEVEHVRGVDAGPVVRSLLERGLIRIAGHREVPGRPMVYATTRRFLEVFGLGKLGDLPALRDLAELDFDEETGAVVTVTPEEGAEHSLAGEGEAEASEGAASASGDDAGEPEIATAPPPTA
jgi:segregation and condensation protein B